MDEENWRPIPGYEGHYDISDRGDVRSWKIYRGPGPHLLIPHKRKNGYLHVVLSMPGGKQTIWLVHQLVLLAFVGPAPDGLVACHFDDNPTNNQLENLRWDTRSANQFDRVRNGIHSSSLKTHCPAGHLYEGVNVRINTNGQRVCRICATAATARYRARKAA